jgi:hypothetical protein
MLCPDPIFRLRMAKYSLESNLKRIMETDYLFDPEETLTKTWPFLRRKDLTPYEEGKKPLHM